MNIRVKDAHASEVRRGKRFKFGRNWRRFLRVLNEERIAEAQKSLTNCLEVDDLKDKTFLDVGSGSGLFSLVARRLGAEVLSFDYDPQSVACTAELRHRYFDKDSGWHVTSGSVLDRGFLESLGTFDVVYAWGVLHHTGAMWQALENVKLNTKIGGRLYIAIYNDSGEVSVYWTQKKITYNKLPALLRFPYAVIVWLPIELSYFRHYWRNKNPRGYFSLWTEYKKSRGMSRLHDMIDWIGGYPYEYASAQKLVDFYESDGFKLRKLLVNDGYGCHQIVFERVS